MITFDSKALDRINSLPKSHSINLARLIIYSLKVSESSLQ